MQILFKILILVSFLFRVIIAVLIAAVENNKNGAVSKSRKMPIIPVTRDLNPAAK